MLIGVKKVYANPAQTRQIVFIDSAVEDYQYLAKLVKPGIETIEIDPQRDGVAQISQVLAQRHRIDAVHLVSHGQPGRVQLGQGELNKDNLPEYRQFLEQWQNSFSDDATILIYGCQVAAADVGVEFVQEISQLTGINIVASNTLTGCAEKGGDWQLQVATKEPVKISPAFQEEGLKKYDRVLATYTINPGDAIELIEAIKDANGTPEDDTIQLAAGSTYTLNLVNDTVVTTHKTSFGTFSLPSNNGLPSIVNQSIAGKLTIEGNGATIERNSLAVDGFRIFHVESGANLTLNNLTVARGLVQGLGGGIYNEGNLEVTNSTIANNTIIGLGGGIYNTGDLTVSGSTLSNNEAKVIFGTGDGGGIYNEAGNVKVIDSDFSGNDAEGSGGGIHNKNGHDFKINNSTLSNNEAEKGGGIYNEDSTTTIINTTISGNQAKINGGGIRNWSDNAPAKITITNSTITGNIANLNHVVGAGGGGIFSSTINGNSIIDLQNSIVAGNPRSSPSGLVGSDVVGYDFIGNQNNLIGDRDGITIFHPNNNGSDLSLASLGITSIDQVLDTTLKLNGAPAGSPLTHALVEGSPAIDAGNNNFATMPNDARGSGFNRISGQQVDIGAYEKVDSQSPTDSQNPTANLTIQDITTSGGSSHTFTVEYQDNLAVDISSLDDADIIVTSPTGQTLNATLDTVNPNSNGTPISATYKIDALGGTWDKADNGSYTVDLQADEVTDTTGNFASAGELGNFEVAINSTLPTFTSQAVVSATEDSVYTYNIDTSEPNDRDRTITAVNPLPSWLTLTDNQDGTATLTGTPSNNDVGNHQVELKVTDSEGDFSVQSWQLVVADVSDPPISQNPTTSNLNNLLENPEVTQIQEQLGLGDVNVEELVSQLPENLDIEDVNIGDILDSDTLDIEEILPLASQVADSGILPEDVNLEEFIPVNPPLTPPSEGGGRTTSKEGESINVFPVQAAANDRINILPTVMPDDDNQDIDTDLIDELAICDHFTELNFGEIFLNRAIANNPENFPNDANTLMGTPDPDVFNGWDGNDTIFGYASADMILGGLGSAVPVGNQVERDLLFGNQGNDTLGGNEGADRIYGGQDDDLMFGGKDDDHLWGDRGDDTVMGNMGSDRIYGGSEDPSLAAEDGSDLLLGGSGDDFLNGNQKDDRLCGGDGNDTVHGGKGDDIVCGHTGNDSLLGDRGNDTLCGGDGDDTLYGGTEFNDAGEDAGEGEDILFGGKGRDRFFLSANSGGDTILDFEIGEDLLLLTGGLTFADLSMTEFDNNTTAISTGNNQLIAILNGVNVGAIGVDDFSFI